MADSTSARGVRNSTHSGRQTRGQEAYRAPTLYQSRQGINSYASLRSTASRFSLNEQFAATRREYEFGYDDASSIWERETVRSRRLKDELDTASILVPNAEEITDSDLTLPLLNADDFCDILCVSRNPSVESILQAYLRLYPLLDPEQQPPHQRQTAEAYSKIIQQAIEILIDHRQKAHKDPIHRDATDGLDYDGPVLNPPSLATLHGESSINEFGTSFDVQKALRNERHISKRRKTLLELVDFEVGHATSVHLSELDQKIRRSMQRLKHIATSGDKATDKGGMPFSTTKHMCGTIATLRASVYGFLQEDKSALSRLDLYQPSFPRTSNRDRFALLQHGRIRPLVAVTLRHTIPVPLSHGDTTATLHTLTSKNCSTEDGLVVEIGSTILPDPVGSIRVSQFVALPFDHCKSLLRLESEQSIRERMYPRLAATIERPTARGQMIVHIASGDWRSQAAETCRYVADFASAKRKYLSVGPLHDLLDRLSTLRPPRVEIAYKHGGNFEYRESYIATERLNQGIRAFDVTSGRDKNGSWTVAAVAEPRYYSLSAKYARDVDPSALELYQPLSISSKPHDLLATDATNPISRRLRMEAEIGTDWFTPGYLALRCLKRAGRFSKVGFEMGFNKYSLYLSLYWSRLGRRINIPFYLCSGSNLRFKTLLLTAILPFAGLTLWELWDRYHRQKRLQQRLATLLDHRYIQKRRDEADTLMTLMAPTVQNRQKIESARNGLVILSAKYGVKARDAGEATAWGAAEVADVTIPLAALVDRGQLFIPAGVRKSYILGFWDPEPEEEKVLHVRYSFQGR
ncbi:hypothetical protein F5B22DRAFT_369726 [Xylaria bambusicola]|uniref:uncharacterized protein n=1 Tax=Xylaria bambusicola TaxID=326684 RepID=UPI002007C11D|nr:uncharacterized protein F5B22DRAFT_369726 [Xylaria bambusicola]KAI0509057.1 hypothetical protein F5B22DRAFT_369726 [Xylaria bambusicola]